MSQNSIESAFIISLIGGIFTFIGGLLYAIAGAICGIAICGAVAARNLPAGFGIGTLVVLLMSVGMISGILVIFGAILIRKEEPNAVKWGSILVIVFCLVGMVAFSPITILGAILGLIGGILGLTWQAPSPGTP